MLELLHGGKRIINVDESWISETEYSRRMWCSPSYPSTLAGQLVMPRLALIAALDTDGHIWFSLTHATTDSEVINLFFSYLCM